mmetsp:Transcript_31107/g.27507  ORF Transcript_31107/g.27507 Transcript_31107/m.27507 type:complete len:92 (+) Transcript_31107:175-450(+)
MEEEIKSKNLTKEEVEYQKSNTGKLTLDDNLLREAIKKANLFRDPSSQMISEELLTYSLSNTIKTVESLEEKLSSLERKSSNLMDEKMDNF